MHSWLLCLTWRGSKEVFQEGTCLSCHHPNTFKLDSMNVVKKGRTLFDWSPSIAENVNVVQSELPNTGLVVKVDLHLRSALL